MQEMLGNESAYPGGSASCRVAVGILGNEVGLPSRTCVRLTARLCDDVHESSIPQSQYRDSQDVEHHERPDDLRIRTAEPGMEDVLAIDIDRGDSQTQGIASSLHKDRKAFSMLADGFKCDGL